MYGGWASEILHQVIDGKHPVDFRWVFTTSVVVQDVATIQEVSLLYPHFLGVSIAMGGKSQKWMV